MFNRKGRPAAADFIAFRVDPRLLRWALIGAVALGLRLYRLDDRSLWFDEIVTIRTAREPSVAQLVQTLDRIDGSRAPLHPLLLHGWMRAFGDSSVSARLLSVALGVATVALVLAQGRWAWSDRVGEIAAWFCAVCPPLVYYSQEVRMYSLVVLLAVASWMALLAAWRDPRPRYWIAYGALLALLFYAHPLAVFMIAAHGLVGIIGVLCGKLPAGRWAAAMIGAAAVAAPWLPRYLGQKTDYPIPRYPIRFLLATPIEYFGGNSLSLLVWGVVIVVGLATFSEGRLRVRTPEPSLAALAWFVVPPTLIYGYSWLRQPIFGQARYTLFIAPAYFLLIASGLAEVPRWLRLALMASATALAAYGLAVVTYAPNHKADWRAAAAWIRGQGGEAVVVVHAGDPRFIREPMEAARYYLKPDESLTLSTGDGESRRPGAIVYHAHVTTAPGGTPPVGETAAASFHGLTITRGVANPEGQDGANRRSP
ncbi:glycosyltransferase family 39 protein [Paludisphaera rhizosphaerae]|uniref:glycosyltransferase family 39 protein n=1 Tax=Paludisphaera rhizosphaerae TaxID=2711216 RepID=UPI0013EB06C1|nr:glycosyltransferase family 39 protein [Paludisphaera rhizosphaerae]